MTKRFKDATILELLIYCRNCEECKYCAIRKILNPSIRFEFCHIMRLLAGTRTLQETISLPRIEKENIKLPLIGRKEK